MPPRADPYAEALDLARAGRFAAAAAAVERFLAVSPRSMDGLILQASLYTATGRAAEAIAACDRALGLDRMSARTHATRGDALQALGRFAEAVESYDAALMLSPDLLVAHGNRGNALAELDRPEDALDSYGKALALAPDTAGLHANRARVLNDLRRFDEAIESADRAIALNPSYANALLHRGKAHYGALRFSEALENFAAAWRIDAGSEEVLTNLGMSLASVGRYDEALGALDQAVATSSKPSAARYQRARVRLLLGDFGGGWDDYAARWDDKIFVAKSAVAVTSSARARLARPSSPNDLAGAHTLLLSEQGVGDQIMFASMIPDVLRLAASTTLVCEARLMGLFEASLPGLTLIDAASGDVRLDDFDCILGTGSLGAALRRSHAAFPGAPYLAPRGEMVDAWRRRLGPAGGRPRIGVSWRGGTAMTGATARSLSLEQLAPLLRLEGCDFISLQYGDPRPEIAAVGANLRAFPPEEIDDFEQLAALTLSLDIVVTIQTALVHLCGAIGQRALVMVPKRPEWRYMASGPSMPWYRSVEILRQRGSEDWDALVARAVDTVSTMLDQHNRS